MLYVVGLSRCQPWRWGVPTRGTNQHAGTPREGKINVLVGIILVYLFFSGIDTYILVDLYINNMI